MTDQKDERIAEQVEVDRALMALYLEVPMSVGDDVKKKVLAERDQLTARIAALEGERDKGLAVFGPGWPHGLVESCQLLQAVDDAMDEVAPETEGADDWAQAVRRMASLRDEYKTERDELQKRVEAESAAIIHAHQELDAALAALDEAKKEAQPCQAAELGSRTLCDCQICTGFKQLVAENAALRASLDAERARVREAADLLTRATKWIGEEPASHYAASIGFNLRKEIGLFIAALATPPPVNDALAQGKEGE